MRWMLATFLTMTLVFPAVADSDAKIVGGAAFSDFKTYWAQKRDGCQPMIAFKLENTSPGEIGPIAIRLEVVDTDKGSAFAAGGVSLPSSDLPPGHVKDISIGGDHDISAHDCLGDMHETAFSAVHFLVRLSATAGPDAANVEIVRDVPMQPALVAAQQ
ncbi:MAG TPA: hypothetical protein VGM32_07965 [Rhodopila sp.]|jgi:hypothetical protein